MKIKLKRIISTVTLFTCIFLNLPNITKAQDIVQTSTNRINFSLEGTATASNTESGQQAIWGPEKAIDGIVNRDDVKSKQSRWATDVGNVERVLTIDLKGKKHLMSLILSGKELILRILI